MNTHVLVLASAGTGKTWQLTTRYLRLVLQGHGVERILATTFTRKAAGEILERVLARLCAAALGGKELDELRAALPGLDVDETKCASALATLAGELGRLRIGTLDSFFAALGRAFAFELALPPDWRIVGASAEEELWSEALARVLADAPSNEMLELLRALQGDGARRAVHSAALEAIRRGRAVSLESDRDAWGRFEPPSPPPHDAVNAALAVIAAAEAPSTKTGGKNSYWTKALDELRELATAGDWRELAKNALAVKVRAGETKYAKVDISGPLCDALRVLLELAASAMARELVRQTRATRDLLERFERAFGEAKAARGALRFDDLPRALAGAFGAESGLDLAFRLDGRVDHLLLDEFQDTAHVQWRCLDTLATEILADGTGSRTFFCVGDVKQSIYGWRGADPELLAGLATRYPVLGPAQELFESRRSSQRVLDAVNRVFEPLASNAAFAEQGEGARAAAEAFASRFRAHRAHKKELPGAVVLLEARAKGEDEAAHRPLVELAIRRVAALDAEAPSATIAVLVRRTAWIGELILGLRERGLAASGEGGNPLTDSAVVAEVLALLELADHPADTLAAFHVATGTLGAALGLAHGDLDAAIERARAVRGAIAEDGYGASIAAIAGELASRVELSAFDRRRVEQLVVLAETWDVEATLRPGDFVRHVRATSVEDPSSARIKVMTVHGAKGLEFDAVVLPELDARVTRFYPAWLVERDAASGTITDVLRWPPKELAGLVPELDARRERMLRPSVEEELSVLYVAMTRAIHRLEMIVPPRSRSKSGDAKVPFTFASIVRASFDALGEDDERHADGEERVLWSHPGNDAAWCTRPRAISELAGVAPETPRRLAFAPERAPRACEPTTPSSLEGGERRPAKAWLRTADPDAIARGVLVHRWLAEIEWLPRTPDDARLDELAAPMTRDDPNVRAAKELFRAALARPDVRALLERPATKDAIELGRERAFAVEIFAKDGTCELWRGSFDRVVIARRAGRVVSAELVDWKTDAAEGRGLDERVAFYRPQILAYRRVLARMTGLDERSIRARLAFLHAGVVVDAS